MTYKIINTVLNKVRQALEAKKNLPHANLKGLLSRFVENISSQPLLWNCVELKYEGKDDWWLRYCGWNSKIPNLQIEYIINSTFVWHMYRYLLIQPDSISFKQKHRHIWITTLFIWFYCKIKHWKLWFLVRCFANYFFSMSAAYEIP